MKYLIPLVLLVAGCTVATADDRACVEVPPAATWDGLDYDGLTRTDVRGAAHTIELTLRSFERLDSERRAKVAEAYGVLAVNCPYTRASMQLPLAMHRVVMSIDPGQLDPLVQRDWANLQRGLTAHVALIAALGGDLAEPSEGDHLHGTAEALLLDRAMVDGAADPIAATMPLIDEITRLVGELDGASTERIERSRMVVDTAIGQTTLGVHLGSWENALRRIEPFVDDAEDKARIKSMIHAVSAWGAQGC